MDTNLTQAANTNGSQSLRGIDVNFLEKIKQKLQTGNTRSIYLSCHPGRLAARLDITSLDCIFSNLSENFLDTLLSNVTFDFEFRVDLSSASLSEEDKTKLGLVNKRLTSIMYENNDNYLEHGIKTIGFGFPLIAYKCASDPDKILNAPIFIWRLELKKDANKWIISRTDENAVFMNETLLNFLEQDLQTTGLTRLPEEALTDSLLDIHEVITHSENLIKEINKNAEELDSSGNFQPIYHKDELRKLITEKGNPFLYKGGIFGLFRAPKEAVIKDIKELIKQFDKFQFDELKIEHYQTIPYSVIDTDPSQRKVLSELSENNRIVIHGPPGTGKSQSLTAIIVNALVNGKKCLVVCEKRTALEVIKNNLAKAGLDELCGLIEDVNRDRKVIIDLFRDREPERKVDISHDLKNNMQLVQSEINFVNKGHSFYANMFIGDMNWTALTGKYLSFENKEIVHKLYNSLKGLTFTFTKENSNNEFEKLINETGLDQKYYKEIVDELSRFEMLEDKYVLSFTSAAELKLDLHDKIVKWMDNIQELTKEGESIIESYDKHLNGYYRDYHGKVNSHCDELMSIYKSNSARGERFLVPNIIDRLGIKVFRVFSDKYKKFNQDRNDYFDIYLKLNDAMKCRYFHAELKSIEQYDYSGSINSTENLMNAADDWLNSIKGFIEGKKQKLSDNEFDRYSGFDDRILSNYRQRTQSMLDELTGTGVFKKEVNRECSSIKEYLEYMSDVRAFLENILQGLNEIPDLYNWRKHYNSLDERTKKTIDNLINHGSESWSDDTGMWYIFNVLLKNESGISLADENSFDKIDKLFEKIINYQRHEILRYWNEKQLIANARFKEKYKFAVSALYNKARNNNFLKRNSLRSIIKYDLDLFTSYFPVLLVNPSVCSSLFELKEGLFDMVIFDEASQLRIEDVFCSKLRGKYKIVSGDENQMPPSSYFATTLMHADTDDDEDETVNISNTLADSESLLDYAIAKGYRETTLDIHYRSKHPDLINFSNAAFYGSRLAPMPERSSYKPIRYFNSASLYDPHLGVNTEEAGKVVELISHLITTMPHRSIGVATLNIFQRNLILDLINEKCNTDNQFNVAFNRMSNIPNEPFFVKNLENIQGDEREVMIISTTFGLRENGIFLQNFGPINRENGFRLLNVVITRAKHELYVVTSIPESYIMNYKMHLHSGSNTGRGIFYAYLAYAKAVSEDDRETVDGILHLLACNSSLAIKHSDPFMTESIFEDEVVDMLSQHISRERLETQYKLGGFRLDIAVKDEKSGRPVIAIECDGAKYHSSNEAYAWDIFRQKQLEEYGLKFYRIWSKNWWNNPEKELGKLVKFVEENGNKF